MEDDHYAKHLVVHILNLNVYLHSTITKSLRRHEWHPVYDFQLRKQERPLSRLLKY